MLDINRIKTDAAGVAKALAKRGYKADFKEILVLDEKRRQLIAKADDMKAERNKVSASVPVLKKEGKDTKHVFERMRKLGDDISKTEAELSKAEKSLNDLMAAVPNIPDDDIAAGGKEENQIIETFGKKPEFNFKAKDHVELCTALGLIDYERGAKLSGSGFCAYRGWGARLEWALINLFIDQHLKDGYEMIMPPYLLLNHCGYGSGQFPKFSGEVFKVKTDGSDTERFLAPTAETSLVNLYANEIIPVAELPKKFFAYTQCFRTEIGSYRAEERGMVRTHQFNKVEMVQYCTPEQSKAAFEELVNKAVDLLKQLGLHFVLSKLAAGDISAGMTRTYDVEVWIPSMGIYKEASSVSNANDYQARRNNTKFKGGDGKNQYVYMLNGSGLATSRVLPALVEQNQNADGSINVPKVLQKYLGVDKICLKN
ncbi:MAG: serine--tRNA ligase [Firmicutes bacterium]|nr:serine--tRNA ligase [Bacillota bacterium]